MCRSVLSKHPEPGRAVLLDGVLFLTKENENAPEGALNEG
jgi:hypothetical protein